VHLLSNEDHLRANAADLVVRGVTAASAKRIDLENTISGLIATEGHPEAPIAYGILGAQSRANLDCMAEQFGLCDPSAPIDRIYRPACASIRRPRRSW